MKSYNNPSIMSEKLNGDLSAAAEEEDEESEWEYEDEEEEEEEEIPDPLVNGKPKTQGGKTVVSQPDIKIQGNVVKIDRKDVVWSDDEYDEDSDDEEIPEPILPKKNIEAPSAKKIETPSAKSDEGKSSSIPAAPPMPETNGRTPEPPPLPPPMPGKVSSGLNGVKAEKVEQLKKKKNDTPKWTDLMEEIAAFRNGHSGKLKKTACNDRSKPILNVQKVGKTFMFESEKNLPNKDILKDIQKGIKLKRVRTNDRSKPNLRGIRSFKRQTTKDERLKQSYAFDGDDKDISLGLDDEENEGGVDQLMDDLESTKQLLELEVRSKKLLEKDNKRLQNEVEKLRQEFQRMLGGEVPESANPDEKLARRNSIANKRNSMIRLLSESESTSNMQQLLAAATAPATDTIEESDADPEATGIDLGAKSDRRRVSIPERPVRVSEPIVPYQRAAIPAFENEVIESMKEEVDEARKLAEEWESKYKEMQRQMTDFEGPASGRKISDLDHSGNNPGYSRATSGYFEEEDEGHFQEDKDDENWMMKREVHQLETKLKNIRGKREIVHRERKLLTERIESITASIANELEARKKLRKELKEMNEAFNEEIEEYESEERTKRELEECYFEDESELVSNPHAKAADGSEEDGEGGSEEYDFEDDECDETLEDILKLAEDEEEDEPGHHLFDHYPDSGDGESEGEENTETNPDYEKKIDRLNGRIEKHGENLQTMRKSNFALKSKIDRLFDILQMQREKHHDLKQELTRMLADIQ